MILENVTILNNVEYDDLVVFVVGPGETINIRNSTFHNGAVVYVEPNYGLRDGPRNEVYLKKTNIFGSVDSDTHIGLLAPGTVVRSPGTNGHPPTFIGTTFIHSVDNVMGATIRGQLIALNSLSHMMHTEIIYDPDIAQWPPDGFEYAQDAKQITLLQIREVFPE